MIAVLASVVALPCLWFIWVKFQQTRWRNNADDLYFEKFYELKAVDFDSLLDKIGQPHSKKEHTIDGHSFVVGWRVDKLDAFSPQFGGFEKIDDNTPTNVWEGQRSWIEVVEIRGYVDYVQPIPFLKRISFGDTFNFLRKKDGSLDVGFPSQEA